MIRIYTELQRGQQWLAKYRGCRPVFACVLGFTDTGLIPGISAAGATPEDRRYTAIADAEFLYSGGLVPAQYPLPPLHAGASPVLISRAVVEYQDIPIIIFDAGLPKAASVPTIDLEGSPARCLTTGKAMERETVSGLLQEGLKWGPKIARQSDGYAIISECVVGGTTTALAVSTGLGIPAMGKVNSSLPQCNHDQKLALVKTGLERAGWNKGSRGSSVSDSPESFYPPEDPLELVAAVGDPMQVAVAGMAIAASRTHGVLLAGGTQMLAVYALTEAIAGAYDLWWRPECVVVGTTRWVAEDPTGDTVGLARAIGSVSLLATQLSFASSRYPQLQAYERGYVKEGVGAGGASIAAHLYRDWNQPLLLQAVEAIAARL